MSKIVTLLEGQTTKLFDNGTVTSLHLLRLKSSMVKYLDYSMELHAPFPEGYNFHPVRGKNVFLPIQSSLLIRDRHKVIAVPTGGLIGLSLIQVGPFRVTPYAFVFVGKSAFSG